MSVIALVSGGCDTGKLLTNQDVAGTYVLSSVGGAALPVTVSSSPRVDLTSGKLILSTDGGFSQVLTQRRFAADGSSSVEVFTEAGAYYPIDGTVTLNGNSGSTAVGDFSNNTLSFRDQSNIVLVYTKQ